MILLSCNLAPGALLLSRPQKLVCGIKIVASFRPPIPNSVGYVAGSLLVVLPTLSHRPIIAAGAAAGADVLENRCSSGRPRIIQDVANRQKRYSGDAKAHLIPQPGSFRSPTFLSAVLFLHVLQILPGSRQRDQT
jgi:hypothetical protein